MVIIKKVDTLVSICLEEHTSPPTSQPCTRSCLGNCCLSSGLKLPLYLLKKDGDEVKSTEEEQPPICFLRNLLLNEWEDRKKRGLFKYDLTTCETRLVPGSYGFIARLNEGRHLKKRPTEFQVDKVLQDFDHSKFNFTKLDQQEVLFRFEQGNNHYNSYFFPTVAASDSTSVAAINVCPIEYGHVLLIPRVHDCFPQRIDRDSLLLALRFARETSDPFFRVGYNCLGAFATINHLHFQAYYLEANLPVEKAPTRRIKKVKKGVRDKIVIISEILDYPVRGLVFEGGNRMQDLSDSVADSCIYLQNNNIPFNMLISDCGKRAFLFPQCYAEKQALGQVSQEILETQVNPGCWEISGHIVLKSSKDFTDASETYVSRILAEVSLSQERFRQVKACVLEAAGFHTNHPEEDYSVHDFRKNCIS